MRECLINGWRFADEPEIGRTGRAYVVWRDGEPTRQFVLKLWRDDQPGLEKSVNAKEAVIPKGQGQTTQSPGDTVPSLSPPDPPRPLPSTFRGRKLKVHEW